MNAFRSFSANSGNSFSGNRGNGGALTLDQIKRIAPSVAAESAHESRSDRYAYIPTIRVLEGLMRADFYPVLAMQGNTRVPGKADFTKHLVRLRHREDEFKVNATVREVVLINSHDGTSSYHLNAGLFRVLCTNGLVTSESYKSVKVPHKGDVQGLVIEGAYEVLGETARAIEASQEWSGIRLNRDESMILAESAHMLRFPAREDETEAERLARVPVRPADILRPRRSGDTSDDLWTTFNVAQENVIRGGQSGRVRSTDGRTRRASVREVTGIDQSTTLNRALWALTERMAALKAA